MDSFAALLSLPQPYFFCGGRGGEGVGEVSIGFRSGSVPLPPSSLSLLGVCVCVCERGAVGTCPYHSVLI